VDVDSCITEWEACLQDLTRVQLPARRREEGGGREGGRRGMASVGVEHRAFSVAKEVGNGQVSRDRCRSVTVSRCHGRDCESHMVSQHREGYRLYEVLELT